VQAYPADWEKGGTQAISNRNTLMLSNGRPEYVVAFPGSLGTRDLLAKAEAADLPIWHPGEPLDWPIEN
jgi:hypothetical protein